MGKQNAAAAGTPQSGEPTQEAGFFSLLGARVREQVEEMDAFTSIQALLFTYDESTLVQAMQDPIQFRYLLQNALPGFLEEDRKVYLRPTLLSNAINQDGSLEGLYMTPCPLQELPQSTLEILAED